MDKKVFTVTTVSDNDASYWKKKTHGQRLEALEQLRRIVFGYDPSTARLQRTFTVTKLKKN